MRSNPEFIEGFMENTALKVGSVEELTQYLDGRNIRYDIWPEKEPEDLLEEIQEGECFLMPGYHPEGRIEPGVSLPDREEIAKNYQIPTFYRVADRARAEIFCMHPERGRLQLKIKSITSLKTGEVRIPKDVRVVCGKIKHRDQGASPEERARSAIIREIPEELNADGALPPLTDEDLSKLVFRDTELVSPMGSRSYIGLLTQGTLYDFSFELPYSWFRDEYVLEEKHAITRWDWDEPALAAMSA